MHLIQTHIEVLSVLMAKSMPEMFRKSLILELQEGSVVSFRKPYRYIYQSQCIIIQWPSYLSFRSTVISYHSENEFLFLLQGVGGIVELAPGYLPAVYNMVRKAGGLCIADEVQAGVARTGNHFWGFESHGVIPDIVTMAKVNLEDPSITFRVSDSIHPSFDEYNLWETHMFLLFIFRV